MQLEPHDTIKTEKLFMNLFTKNKFPHLHTLKATAGFNTANLTAWYLLRQVKNLKNLTLKYWYFSGRRANMLMLMCVEELVKAIESCSRLTNLTIYETQYQIALPFIKCKYFFKLKNYKQTIHIELIFFSVKSFSYPRHNNPSH
jgi:hypothetical protein